VIIDRFAGDRQLFWVYGRYRASEAIVRSTTRNDASTRRYAAALLIGVHGLRTLDLAAPSMLAAGYFRSRRYSGHDTPRIGCGSLTVADLRTYPLIRCEQNICRHLALFAGALMSEASPEGL
jgi:hypothetical protein